MRILVVDDDPVMLKMVATILSRAGYEVLTARDGKEALMRVDSIQPDLIILDVMMPEMDGYEVCRRLRSKPSTAVIPIMMLTATGTLESKIAGYEAGSDDYMVKPFEPAELEARVRALLRRRAAPPEAVAAKPEMTSKVIAVFSLRGGMGVSTLATNLAAGLVRIWEVPTVLVDMVFTCGQCALMLNLPLRNTWANLTRIPFTDRIIPLSEVDAAMVNQVLLSHPCGVRVLAAPPTPMQGEEIDAERVTQVLALLRQQNHYMVLDLPHDFRDTTLAALDAAHQIVYVTAPDIASVHAASRALQVFEELGYARNKIFLILNWTFQSHGLPRKDIEAALRHPIDVVIPFASEPLVDAINTGIPPVIKSAEEPLTVLFEDLAFMLSKEEHKSRPPDAPTAVWKRIWRRQQKRQQTR
jgi:pilus assembly protein CpaE